MDWIALLIILIISIITWWIWVPIVIYVFLFAVVMICIFMSGLILCWKLIVELFKEICIFIKNKIKK